VDGQSGFFPSPNSIDLEVIPTQLHGRFEESYSWARTLLDYAQCGKLALIVSFPHPLLPMAARRCDDGWLDRRLVVGVVNPKMRAILQKQCESRSRSCYPTEQSIEGS
jgi:hypothetical protein